MEMHTFAAFVFEELPLDVLSFYLTVRYIMLEGRELRTRDDYHTEVRTQTSAASIGVYRISIDPECRRCVGCLGV